MEDLKSGDTVTAIFENLNLRFKVSKSQPVGPDVYLDHDGGEIHVRKQDIRDRKFELEVKKCP